MQSRDEPQTTKWRQCWQCWDLRVLERKQLALDVDCKDFLGTLLDFVKEKVRSVVDQSAGALVAFVAATVQLGEHLHHFSFFGDGAMHVTPTFRSGSLFHNLSKESEALVVTFIARSRDGAFIHKLAKCTTPYVFPNLSHDSSSTANALEAAMRPLCRAFSGTRG